MPLTQVTKEVLHNDQANITIIGTLGTLTVSGNATVGNLTASGNVVATNLVGAITSGQVTTALGFTPYNSTNPSGYTTLANVQSYVQTAGQNSQGAKTVQAISAGVPSNATGNNGDIIYQY